VTFSVAGPCLVCEKFRVLRKDWLREFVARNERLKLWRPLGTKAAVETDLERK
jgi:hypothetical protein